MAASKPLAPLDAPRIDVANVGANAQELRAAIAAAVLAGDDVEAARLMALLTEGPKLRVVR